MFVSIKRQLTTVAHFIFMFKNILVCVRVFIYYTLFPFEASVPVLVRVRWRLFAAFDRHRHSSP